MVGVHTANDADPFRVIWDPLANAPLRVELELGSTNEVELTRGEIATEQPIVARRMSGRRLEDIIWTGNGIPVILSERIVNLLQENGFTGWTTYPITLYAKAGVVLPGYCGLVITGRCGTADWSRSQRVLKEYPAGFFPVWRGLHIAEWDGSDFFMASTGLIGYKFVTDRVRVAFAREHIRNIDFLHLADRYTDKDPTASGDGSS